ncbi:FkbM family methyltransferase [Acidimicrobiaceae bacterium]|nr:FkbM family methyltransferase [Acidimicrobiaceae bacterium]
MFIINSMFSTFNTKYKVKPDCQITDLNNIYKSKFGFKKDGIFVEVGAYDGDRWSNTCFLADLGWKGLYIEPVNEFYLKCVERHKKNSKIEVLNLAIGEEEKDVEIFIAQGLSTILESQKNFYEKSQFSKHVKFTDTQICKQRRLENVLIKKKINPGFDLLVVDTEGYEKEVINSFDLEFWRPKLLIVELPHKNENFQDFKEFIKSTINLREKIIDSNYKVIYEDDINTVFNFSS